MLFVRATDAAGSNEPLKPDSQSPMLLEYPERLVELIPPFLFEKLIGSS